jgi:hypothetical protein
MKHTELIRSSSVAKTPNLRHLSNQKDTKHKLKPLNFSDSSEDLKKFVKDKTAQDMSWKTQDFATTSKPHAKVLHNSSLKLENSTHVES